MSDRALVLVTDSPKAFAVGGVERDCDPHVLCCHRGHGQSMVKQRKGDGKVVANCHELAPCWTQKTGKAKFYAQSTRKVRA